MLQDHLLLEWLTATYALGKPLRADLVARGQTNPFGVMRVRTERGDFGVKQYTEPPRDIALVVENAAYQAGFPLPSPVFTPDGARITTYSYEGQTAWVLVYSWVEGEPYPWGTVNPLVSAQIGALLAQMHRVPVDPQVMHEMPWMPLGNTGWSELAIQADHAHIEWSPLLLEKITALVAWEEHVLAHTIEDEPWVPSQRDLHPPNVLLCTNGAHVVVDWDAAGPVLAREDVAMFAFVWAKDEDGEISAAAVRAFIEGYRFAGGHYKSRGVPDLTQQYRSLLAWTAYNVRLHVTHPPGPNPWLPPALLSVFSMPRHEELERLAALLNVA